MRREKEMAAKRGRKRRRGRLNNIGHHINEKTSILSSTTLVESRKNNSIEDSSEGKYDRRLRSSSREQANHEPIAL